MVHLRRFLAQKHIEKSGFQVSGMYKRNKEIPPYLMIC